MGYYTSFELTWVATDGDKFSFCSHEKKQGVNFCSICGKPVGIANLDGFIANYIAQHDEMSHAIGEDGTSLQSVKWYSHIEDVKELSRLIPNVLLTLRGEGEVVGDIWVQYFFNGMSYKEKAQIIFNDFDADKLR